MSAWIWHTEGMFLLDLISYQWTTSSGVGPSTTKALYRFFRHIMRLRRSKVIWLTYIKRHISNLSKFSLLVLTLSSYIIKVSIGCWQGISKCTCMCVYIVLTVRMLAQTKNVCVFRSISLCCTGVSTVFVSASTFKCPFHGANSSFIPRLCLIRLWQKWLHNYICCELNV